MNLVEKEQRLTEVILSLGRVIIAYSGGVDSSYLAFKAHRILGDAALAVTGESPSVSSRQREMAARVASEFGFPHEIIRTGEVDNDDYRANPSNRCFFCKDELFAKLREMADKRGFQAVVDGSNADDLIDFRPGRQAADLHSVRSPLLEAGLTKNEIRELSRRAGLPTADEPASACLASRFPYGVRITAEKLRKVDRGEEALRRMGFRIFRVRHHDDMVRLEFGREDLERALNLEMAGKLTDLFKGLGYRFVTIDLEGYRSGSANEVLTRID